MKKRVSHTGLDQQEGEQITAALLSGWKSYIPLTVCSTSATLGFKTAMENTSSSLIYLHLWCGLGISKRPRLFVWYHVVPKRLIISLISLSCTVGKRGRHGGSCLDWLEKRTQRCNYLDDCRQWLSALIKIRLTAQQGVESAETQSFAGQYNRQISIPWPLTFGVKAEIWETPINGHTVSPRFGLLLD